MSEEAAEDLVGYKIALVHLPLPDAQIRKLMALGHHGIRYNGIDCTPGEFIGAMFNGTDDGQNLGILFHHKVGSESVKRSFFILPAHHGFTAPAHETFKQLGAALTTTGTMFVLYEVTDERDTSTGN